jgi:hypothetical protein
MHNDYHPATPKERESFDAMVDYIHRLTTQGGKRVIVRAADGSSSVEMVDLNAADMNAITNWFKLRKITGVSGSAENDVSEDPATIIRLRLARESASIDEQEEDVA